jgi:hypothetical protein
VGGRRSLQHLDPAPQRVGTGAGQPLLCLIRGAAARPRPLFRPLHLLTLFVGCDARQSALPVAEFDQAIARVREVSLPYLNSRETNRTTVRVGTPPADVARMLANPSAPAWSARQHGPLQGWEG